MQGQYFGSNEILDKLKKSIAEMESTISEQTVRGEEVDSSLELALSDAYQLLNRIETNNPSVPQPVEENNVIGKE